MDDSYISQAQSSLNTRVYKRLLVVNAAESVRARRRRRLDFHHTARASLGEAAGMREISVASRI